MPAKVCFVTGSGRRIGASIIRKFAEEGYAVLIHVSTSIEAGETLKSELIGKGCQADLLQGDLLDTLIRTDWKRVSSRPAPRRSFG